MRPPRWVAQPLAGRPVRGPRGARLAAPACAGVRVSVCVCPCPWGRVRSEPLVWLRGGRSSPRRGGPGAVRAAGPRLPAAPRGSPPWRVSRRWMRRLCRSLTPTTARGARRRPSPRCPGAVALPVRPGERRGAGRALSSCWLPARGCPAAAANEALGTGWVQARRVVSAPQHPSSAASVLPENGALSTKRKK